MPRRIVLLSCTAFVLASVACGGPPSSNTAKQPLPPTPRDAGPPPTETSASDIATSSLVVSGASAIVCVLRDQKADCVALSNDGTWDNQRALLAGAKKLPPVRALAMGKAHACALTLDNDAVCWGDERMVFDDRSDPSTPRPVSGAPKLKTIVARGTAACGITMSDQAVCWGVDSWHDPGKPKPVKGVEGVEEIAVSGGHACARDRKGQVFCWGGNWRGELGTPADHVWHTTAVKVPLRVPARSIALAEGASCALTAAGEATCWGGTFVNKEEVEKGPPQKFEGLPRAETLALSRMTDGCVVTPEHELHCWGDVGATLQVHGIKTGRLWPPRTLATDVTALAASYALNCFADTHGAVRCWGTAACVANKCEVVPVAL